MLALVAEEAGKGNRQPCSQRAGLPQAFLHADAGAGRARKSAGTRASVSLTSGGKGGRNRFDGGQLSGKRGPSGWRLLGPLQCLRGALPTPPTPGSLPVPLGITDVGQLPVFPPLLRAIAVTGSSELMTALLSASSHTSQPH